MDQRSGSPERLVPRPDTPPPGPSLARWQLEKFSDIWVPNYRASSPPSSESFQLTRKQDLVRVASLSSKKGWAPDLGGQLASRRRRHDSSAVKWEWKAAGRRRQEGELTLLACSSWMKLEMWASAKQKGAGRNVGS